MARRRSLENSTLARDGDAIQIDLAEYASSLNIRTLETVGTVIHPARTFNYSVPEAVPADWASKKFVFKIHVLASNNTVNNNPKTAYWHVCSAPARATAT